MNRIFTLIAAVLLGGVTVAQNVRFEDTLGNALPDTITISYDADDTYLDEHNNLSYYNGVLKNNSMADVNLVLSREVIEYVSDSVEVDKWGDGILVWESPEDQFCWGMCYMYGSSDSFIELGPSVLAANSETQLEAIVHYTHYKIPGTTILKYKAVNGLDTEDELIVKFIIGKTVGTIDNSMQYVKLYPNPCRESLYLKNIKDVRNITISNILGQPVFSTQSIGNEMQLNVADLKNGVYFVTLIDEENKVKTERILKQ